VPFPLDEPAGKGAPRIGLIGAECSGKSALAQALAHALDGVIATEVLREFVEGRGRPPKAGEQRAILHAQQDREDSLAAADPHRLVIGDPAALMTAVYSVAYFADDSLLDEAVALAGLYDLIVWCDIDLPWEPDDGQRDGPVWRQQVHDLVEKLVVDRQDQMNLIRASGTLEERVGTVRRAWQQSAPNAPT
jgi:nicotinamide riboside kinase